MQHGIEHILKRNTLIPVVTINNPADVERVAHQLIAANVSCIEITLRTEFAWEAIAQFKQQFGDQFDVGVGTVVNGAQVERARSLGVDFMVCPGCTPALAQHLEHSGIPFLPGVSTPSEIIKGLELGWRYFKFFPANLFGGVKALSTYAAVFGDAKFCPTGGVSESNYQEFLALENVIAVGGSWLVQ